MDALTDLEAEALLYEWKVWARESQLAPTHRNWVVWMVLAGRGFGKTRTGVEWLRSEQETGNYGRFAIIGQTAADVRDVLVEGESGLLAISPSWNKPIWEPSKRRITWPNGAIATTYSGDEPEQLRGPQHDRALADELAKWRYAQEAWDNLEFGMRLSEDPKTMVTTTPRPIPIIKNLLADPDCVSTRGSTFDNFANLPASFIKRVISKYEGTRLGRQELYAEILDDTPGALWTRALIESSRVRKHPDFIRAVTGVDPSVSNGEDTGAETGIVAVGTAMCDCKGFLELHAFVVEDASTGGTPNERFGAAVTTHYKIKGDKIVGEVNNGGDLVKATIQTIDPDVKVDSVTASRGKQTRAEPVSALYEQGKVHHVGMFALLEDQQCEWVPGNKSPDRMDALVWALTDLMLGKQIPEMEGHSW